MSRILFRIGMKAGVSPPTNSGEFFDTRLPMSSTLLLGDEAVATDAPAYAS